ncbi:hypothetical protein [Prevotella conceptionensis]|uniref:hypothetical protein n=1 Tax=Prevotella conceptionensis TaxID=340486 RepID=UPI0002EB24A7|nr:hypothetical protein [Prevotella conceptionensis]
MAIYNQGKLAGIVGYKQLYPNGEIYPLEKLLTGLPRIWAIRLVSNMQNKLVGKPFYNPDFKDEETTQIDVPRFFFGPNNLDQLLDVIHRYKAYSTQETEKKRQPMEYATGSETPLLLLKYIMSMQESDGSDHIVQLEKKLYTAFLIANEFTLNRNQGEAPYKLEDDLELYLACLLMSRYTYNDFINQESDINELVRNQNIRTGKFFNFVSQHPQLKDLYDEFLQVYGLISWKDYLRTYWSILALARYKTGVINFERLRDEDELLSEQIVDKDSIDIHEVISLEDNVDYQAFREKPFIKIAPHEYAVIDVSFMIYRMFDGLYFIFNDLWQCKHPDNTQGFNTIFTTEFSEGTVLVNCLKEVANTHGWLSLTDNECKSIVPERKLSSPPDFYIRDGKDVILFECKDVKIPKEVKAEGTIQQLLDEVDKDSVGYHDTKKNKWRYKGVGQLVRNAKRILEGEFIWDKNVDKNNRIFLVLVLADGRQVDAGWKNYLQRKMREECIRQETDYKKICPLILTDLGTITFYKGNFKKSGFLQYFISYYEKTTFNPSTISIGDTITNVMNQTMSFSRYMNGERLLDSEELRKDVMSAITKRPKQLGHHSYVTKTVEYTDLFDDNTKESVSYLNGINKRWLIEGVVHMISVDGFDSFSMNAEHGLLVMFQDYREKPEVKRLFRRLKAQEEKFNGTWLTLINHQALYRLLTKVLRLPNEKEGIGESFEAYEALLKAILVENSMEMQREKEILVGIDGDTDIRDAKIIMQQDVLNIDLFGENKKELEKAQILKFMTLTEFGKEHKEVGEAIRRVVNKYEFPNEITYMLVAQMPLAIYHDKENFKEGLYYIRQQDYEQTKSLQLWNEFVKYISDKCIDIWDTEKMGTIFAEKELLDNTCFRKYPVLKMSKEEYLIVSQPYYTHLLFDGFWWSVKEELKLVSSEEAIMNLLTKEFSEEKLFYELVKLMIGDKRIQIYNNYCFEAQQSAPDIAIKTRHHLFMFEYKDMRVNRKVADGGNMNQMMDFIDNRLNKKKGETGGNKGLPQLVSNMEDFFTGKAPWKEYYGKGKVIVHPIIVINSRLFGVRGINYIMQHKLQQRILESEILREHIDEIEDLLIVDYDMMILVASWSYKNFRKFHNLLYGYQTYVRKGRDIVTRCTSYRHYVMNKWELEKTKKDEKKFGYNYKKVLKAMLSQDLI